MKTIEIPNVTKSCNVQYMLRNGHVPSVLSLANLRGKAKQYKWTYIKARETATRIAAHYGIENSLVLLQSNRRWCRVWTQNGEPVRIILT